MRKSQDVGLISVIQLLTAFYGYFCGAFSVQVIRYIIVDLSILPIVCSLFGKEKTICMVLSDGVYWFLKPDLFKHIFKFCCDKALGVL